MPQPLPAISLVAVPGRRRQTLDIAREIERRGFSGIYMPSRYCNMAQCTALALATETIRFGTAIVPIYAQTAEEFAVGATYIHEVSGGRFRFGIGVAHGPTHQRLGISPGKPLADTRAFVDKLKSYEGIGALPPIVLAALRRRMVALAAEIARDPLDPAEALDLVGLAHRRGHFPAELSGGEQQRVALARALAPNPAILVADEPTGNLDEQTGRDIVELLFRGHAERGTTLVLVTHDNALAARCDRVIRLRSGQIESRAGAVAPA